MKTNEIYEKITENIIHQFTSFKKNEINPKNLNENLLLNLSSMCKFLKGKETLNNSTLDVYLPTTRLEQAINSGIKGSTEADTTKSILDDLKDEDQMGNKLQRNLTIDLNYQNESFFENGVMESDKDYRDSVMSLTMLSTNENKDNVSNFSELLDKSEISSIYQGTQRKNNLDVSTVSNISLFNEQSFNNFHQKIQKTHSNDDVEVKYSTNLYQQHAYNSAKNQNKMKSFSNFDNESSLDESSSIVNLSNSNCKSKGSSITDLVKQIIEEVNGELKEKAVREFIKEMNADYIRSMYHIYSQIKDACNKNKECENLIFINKFKSFVLDIGISGKKFYEQCIREIIYNKNNLKFLEFLLCFHKLIYLKFDQNFLKYKFLFHITKKKNEEFLEREDLDKFYDLLKAKKIYDAELYNKITTKLVDRYRDIFPNDSKLYTRKVALVLEQFFDLK